MEYLTIAIALQMPRARRRIANTRVRHIVTPHALQLRARELIDRITV